MKRSARVSIGALLPFLWATPPGAATSNARTEKPFQVQQVFKNTVDQVVWRPDSRQLAVLGSDGGGGAGSRDSDWSVRLWNPSTGKQVREISAPSGFIVGVDWTREGLLFEVRRRDESTLWNATSRKPGRDPKVRLRTSRWSHGGWAYSPDGKYAARNNSLMSLSLIDPATERELKVLPPGGGWDFGRSPVPVAWSPDSRYVAAAAYQTPKPDEVVRVWEVETGKVVFSSAPSKDSGVLSIAWSQDGKRLVYSWSSGTLCMLEWAAREQRTWMTEEQIVALAGSPDGKWLAGGCYSGKLLLWRLPR